MNEIDLFSAFPRIGLCRFYLNLKGVSFLHGYSRGKVTKIHINIFKSAMTTLDFFTPHINSIFTAMLDGDLMFPITLFEATALAVREFPGRTRDPFQLKFRGDESVLLHQRIHKLKHEVLGDLEIFLVPVGQEDGHYIYQAVYN